MIRNINLCNYDYYSILFLLLSLSLSLSLSLFVLGVLGVGGNKKQVVLKN